MYVNQIDKIFDIILDDLNILLIKEDAFKKIMSDINFVKYQNKILELIKNFVNNIPKKLIKDIVTKDDHIEIITNIIKRYCAYYIYFGIAYYYNASRDLYITNIIEISKSQATSTYQITNFFNSDSNSKIILGYHNIKNFLSLLEFKTIDKIKLMLLNNPIKYESTAQIFLELGEDYISKYFLMKDNFHNIIKTLIFRQIYIKNEKTEILNILNQQEKDNAEYKYIDIIISNNKKIVDFTVIQKFLNINQLKKGLAEEIYTYLEETRNHLVPIMKNNDYISYLFDNNIIIPISEDFLRFHKDTEKYGDDNDMNRE